MAWLWSSWKEYKEFVQPVIFNSRGVFILAARGSWFHTLHRLSEIVLRVENNLESLNQLGFTGEDNNSPPADPEVVDKAYTLSIDLINHTERLLLYHKRLATSNAAYGFLHQNEVFGQLERDRPSDQLSIEIKQLVKDTIELIVGYHEMVETDDQFLVHTLDLPHELAEDFLLSRNLFSVGFDDLGVLVAGRGLEGVLRKLAEKRNVMIEIKGKPEPASDADFHDLIEVMFRLRWKVKRSRLITPEIRALLHYLRAIRNGGAHANIHGRTLTISPRETTALVAETANRLWKDITGTRAILDQTSIPKNW
jgi:hypothetical protein